MRLKHNRLVMIAHRLLVEDDQYIPAVRASEHGPHEPGTDVKLGRDIMLDQHGITRNSGDAVHPNTVWRPRTKKGKR